MTRPTLGILRGSDSACRCRHPPRRLRGRAKTRLNVRVDDTTARAAPERVRDLARMVESGEASVRDIEREPRRWTR
ncbi:hypothetical protein GCM10010104_43280 [Streptomyces indiaensis]|uniref:FXSXX-COOH protein n=1 Tax=Streptomyces indiaensis TaxID=284033 RepID=A0ABN3DVG9_9ACTN